MNGHTCKQKTQFMKKYKSEAQWDLVSYPIGEHTSLTRLGGVKGWEKIANAERGQWNPWNLPNQNRGFNKL